MRHFVYLLVVLSFILTGCNPIKGNSTIDWVDFVKLGLHEYEGLHTVFIKDPSDVTDKVVGEVKFKVEGVVTNPRYRTKSGDAAFLEIGTKLYRVNGFDGKEVIAAKDETKIGGYRLYTKRTFLKEHPHQYADIQKDKIERIDLYHDNETTAFKSLQGEEKDKFIEILESGKNTMNYSSTSDATYYEMTFYSNDKLGYVFTLIDDSVNVFFRPWNPRILDGEIRGLMQ